MINQTSQQIKKRLSPSKQNQENTEQDKQCLEQLITDPLHLKLLILAGTDLKIAELQQINQCVNLMKLDISSNHLQLLPPNIDFSKFSNLRLLYLHNNNLSDMESLNQIFKCKQVVYLTLFRNPLSELNSIRHYIINQMPSLKCLDFNYVLDEERSDILIADDNQSARYYQLSKLSWPVVIYPNDENLTEQQYLSILFKEISIITTQHRKCSFILTIQRFIRGFIVRRQVTKIINSIQKKENAVIKYAAKWKQYIFKKRQLKEVLADRKKQYLLEDTKMYRHARALNKLAQLVREFNKKLQLRKRYQRAARILMKAMSNKKAYFYSYENYLSLTSNEKLENGSSVSLYMREDQLKLVDNEEFKKFMVLFASDSAYFKPKVEEFCSNFGKHIIKGNPYQIFRVPDQDSIVIPNNPLIQLIKPSLNCKIIQRKKYNDQNIETDKYYHIQRHPILMKYQRIVYIKEKFLTLRYKLSEGQRQKSLDKSKKLQIFSEKRDHILFEIKFPHNKVLSYFLRTVVYMNQDVDQYLDDYNQSKGQKQNQNEQYNKQQKEKILVFFSSLLEKVSSAMKIQQIWRLYIIKKYMKKQNINPYEKLLEHHASSKLQRWVKKLSYQHKTSFMKDIYHHLTNIIKTKQLFLHEQIYLKLLQYQNQQQYIGFLNKKDSLFSFRSQSSRIYFNKNTDQIIVRNIEPEFIKSVFPAYVNRVFSDQGFDDQMNTQFMLGDIYHILHVGCKITRHEIGPMNYIQIDFPSLSQALYRTAVLALKTYNFRMNGSCVKLQPYHHILDCNIILPYEEKLQIAYRMQIQEIEGRDNHQIKKEIDNKLSMFVCSDFQKQFILQGIDTTTNFGYKQIHMFTQSAKNKPPQKIINNLIYFLSDNIYMNINEQKEDINNPGNNLRLSSLQQSRKASASLMRERNSIIVQKNSIISSNQKSQITSPKNNEQKYAENNLQEYSQNLFISQFYLEEGQSEENKVNFNYHSHKKNDSTAAQSRNSSINYVSNRDSYQSSSTSYQYGKRRSLSSLVSNPQIKQTAKKAILRQQDLQFNCSIVENEIENTELSVLKEDTQGNSFKLNRKLHSSSTSKNNKNLNNLKAQDNLRKDEKNLPGIMHSSLLQNDLIRSKVVKPNFRDSKEINRFIKEREQDDVESKKMRVILQKDRKEEIKEMNQQLLHLKVLEKAQVIRSSKQANEQKRALDQYQQQQNIIQQAQSIRNHSVLNSDQSKIENSLILNTNFLNKQIASFQSKKNKQELQQINYIKAQSIKNQKLLNFIPKTDINKNRSFSLSKQGGLLNQLSINESDTQFQQYQHNLENNQESSDNQVSEILQQQKRSTSICDRSMNNHSQIIVSSKKNEMNISGLYENDELSRKSSINKKLPSLEKTKQVLNNYLQNSAGYNPSGGILPQLNANENSPTKMQNESIILNVKQRQYLGSQVKKRIQSSNQKERIIHSVFPEEFYPIANGQADNQFLFDFNIDKNKKQIQKPLSQQTHKK
ncbi:hypothetical protein TTHERM_01299690 (macronuclear) [Tetrahymena thermophila SB210]|uniref:IQ calmodulin-binding motif protein n=1 Tax=Tetrahymena thermophila (strain SB210) TaxID=312017 RepID=Q24BA8_TETTS|nr:hypothetical protein TTHERM_01299690 [Tetrahymena thermophila SB210]EAS05063.2 hypothetical protein TTHERM_01299690 [Tetrahymena thermophila SB210]|eukprot:XP_001025308.2 hypothetical protein TTHERM_01299690 [Tetrahymena thermophila SB210]